VLYALYTDNENVTFNRLSVYGIHMYMNELGATVTYDASSSTTGGWIPSNVTNEHVVVCQHRM